MWVIIESAIGNVVGAVIIGLLGIGGTTVVINSITGSSSYNPRKKWRILMVIALLIGVPTDVMITTYVGGTAHTSEFGRVVVWMTIIAFGVGWIGNWVNK